MVECLEKDLHVDLELAKSSRCPPLTYRLPIVSEENQARLGDDGWSAGSRNFQGLSRHCSAIVHQTGAIEGYLLQRERGGGSPWVFGSYSDLTSDLSKPR